VELSRTTLSMLVDGTRVDLPIETVLRIDTRTDSVKNGAIIGAGVMLGGAALTCALGYARDAAQCATGIAFNTLFGALAGAGIDALHKGRTTIYSKPAATALAVAPTRKGARAQFSLRW
jgi:predicted alpha/beta-fold hydrolase